MAAGIFRGHLERLQDGDIVPWYMDVSVDRDQTLFVKGQGQDAAPLNRDGKGTVLVRGNGSVFRMAVDPAGDARKGRAGTILNDAGCNGKAFGLIGLERGILRYQILVVVAKRALGRGFRLPQDPHLDLGRCRAPLSLLR